MRQRMAMNEAAARNMNMNMMTAQNTNMMGMSSMMAYSAVQNSANVAVNMAKQSWGNF